MDNMNYNPYENNPNPYGYRPYKRGNAFETASMTLGIVSVVMCSIIYLSFPFGALAIIFASLSRGRKMEMGAKAKVGLILGIVGIVITAILYIYTLYFLLQNPENFEEMLREACETLGYDYETLFGDMPSY